VRVGGTRERERERESSDVFISVKNLLKTRKYDEREEGRGPCANLPVVGRVMLVFFQ
jgi:hypothetical protein